MAPAPYLVRPAPQMEHVRPGAADRPSWRSPARGAGQTCAAGRGREAPKKVSAVAFSGDGRAALFADKFGDVLVAAAPEPDAAAAPAAPAAAGAGPAGAPAAEDGGGAGGAAPEAQGAPAAACSAAGERNGGGGAAAGPRVKPALLLGHFCSTVTALAVAPGGRLLASADRDAKVRVSVLPRRPLLVRARWRAPTGAGGCRTCHQMGKLKKPFRTAQTGSGPC